MGTEVASSEDNFAEAEKAKDLVMKDRLVLKRKREEVDTVVTSLQKYEDGELQEPPTEAVLEYLNQVGVEKALYSAVPAALQQPPSKRGHFDIVTMDEIRNIVTTNAEGLSKELAAGALRE